MGKVLAVAGVALVVLALAAMSAVFIVLAPDTVAYPPAPAARTSEAPVQPAPDPVIVSGTVVLKLTWDTAKFGDRLSCTGEGEYADIAYGAQVVVTDPAGKTIGLARLTTGVLQEPGCTFQFAASVPGGHEFYGVEVANRGRSQFSAAQLAAPIELPLGE
ncbi:hypothetical protein [Nonomuraea sp. NPDC050202]|jgi:hypothetical protein|uniref:hypothetical protein n=1 Tax=Nonomuraea sp. NPDC050202 TaxID=3155035 RepID=UPI0033FB49D3